MTSCADGADPAADPSPSPSSPTSAATSASATSPTPPSDSEAASEAAAALVRKYYETVDRLGQQPSAPLRDLGAVAVGIQLSAQKTLLKSQRKSGDRQTGDTAVVKLDIESVNLDNSDPKAGKVPTVTINVCWDVSKVDVVDSKGKSIVVAGRPDVGWTQLTVANYHYAPDPSAGWRVATGQDLNRTPCEAS